jgi:hypothetical protein
MYGPTPTAKQINARLAAAVAERGASVVAPPIPAHIQPIPIVKPQGGENKAFDAAVLAQAQERGLKGTAYVLEQKAMAEERQRRLVQFYCAHTYVNVPVVWYGATVYPRLCSKCGHVRSSDYV